MVRNVGYHFLGFNYIVMKDGPENLRIPARSKTTVCTVAAAATTAAITAGGNSPALYQQSAVKICSDLFALLPGQNEAKPLPVRRAENDAR